MKVFLTGASGILGNDIQTQLEKENYEVLGFNSSNIDITNYDTIKGKIKDYNPDVVIHSAAMTNVDLCEEETEKAIKINVIATQNMAMAAESIGAKIVYISSCGVYGNSKLNPYTELDATQPVNFHHYTKLEGEKRVKEHHKEFIIVRPGWLFGGTTQHKKNFVEARRKEAEYVNSINSVTDKIGSPTYTKHLAQQLSSLINLGLSGTFNIVNEGVASRFDYVTEIIKLFGFKTKVKPVSSDSFIRKAIMPDNESLSNMHLNLRQLNNMPHWKEAMKEYIKETYH